MNINQNTELRIKSYIKEMHSFLDDDDVIVTVNIIKKNGEKFSISYEDNNEQIKMNNNFDIEALKQISIKEALHFYVQYRGLKNTSSKNLRSAFNQVFKDLAMSWENIPMCSVTSSDISIPTNKTSNAYYNLVNSVFNYFKNNFGLANPFDSIVYWDHFYGEGSHRAALGCEDWQTLKDAKFSISKFFTDIRNIFRKQPVKYYFVLVHMILGTRRNETYNVIKECNSDLLDSTYSMKFVKIRTKTIKVYSKELFKIPLNNLCVRLICKIKKEIINYSEEYFIELFVRIFKKNGMNMSLHGSRSIYRTTIDLIMKTSKGEIFLFNYVKDFDLIAKELYISHHIQKKIQRIYNRNDYYLERQLILFTYANFILECAGELQLQQELMEEFQFMKKEYEVL